MQSNTNILFFCFSKVSYSTQEVSLPQTWAWSQSGLCTTLRSIACVLSFTFLSDAICYKKYLVQELHFGRKEIVRMVLLFFGRPLVVRSTVLTQYTMLLSISSLFDLRGADAVLSSFVGSWRRLASRNLEAVWCKYKSQISFWFLHRRTFCLSVVHLLIRDFGMPRPSNFCCFLQLTLWFGSYN